MTPRVISAFSGKIRLRRTDGVPTDRGIECSSADTRDFEQRNIKISVSGTATQAGRPLEKASMVFTGGALRSEVTTDDRGFFRLPPVSPGQYTAAISPADLPRDQGPGRSGEERRVGAPVGKTAASIGSRATARGSGGQQGRPLPREDYPADRRRSIVSIELLECASQAISIEF